MSETIPEDIWTAAYVVFNGERPITPGAIARALMAERERGARIETMPPAD